MLEQQDKRQKLVVLTGSGISAESGLQTFRDHGGLWAGHRVEDVATPEAFDRHPQQVLDFYNQLRRQMQTTQPNAAHKALVRLEEFYQVNIITQNVDDLHERAGSSNVLHLHGELLKARSSVDGNAMRPFIVWFGEAVPLLDEAIELTRQADILIVIGTSLQVYPAASLLQFVGVNAEVFLVDPKPPQNLNSVQIIRANAQSGVTSLVQSLIERKN